MNGKGQSWRSNKTPITQHLLISLVAQTVKRLSTMWETWVWSLGREDPWRRKWQPTAVLTLASKIPWTEEPGVHGVSESQTRLSDFTFFLSEYNSSINVNHNRMDFFWSYYTFDTVHSRFTFHKELSYFHMYFHMCLFGMWMEMFSISICYIYSHFYHSKFFWNLICDYTC